MQNFKNAFQDWRARCEKCPDNIALFYFCGHGLSKGAQFLLPEDFGNPTWNQWENCIDFDAMRVGMVSVPVETQLFFADACRETPFTMLSNLQIRGYTPVTANVYDAVNCSAAYYATGEGRQAHGPDDDVSYFGRAVILCLNGVGALNRQNKWIVDSYQLASALGHVMYYLKRRHDLALTCNPNVTGMALIHEAAGPRVAVTLECTSQGANNAAEFILQNGQKQIHSPAGDPKPFFAELDGGDWQVQVCFPGGQYTDPPVMNCKMAPPVYEGFPIP